MPKRPRPRALATVLVAVAAVVALVVRKVRKR